MHPRLLRLLGVLVALTLGASTAYAQLEQFTHAVRQLAEAGANPDPSRSSGIRPIVERMAAALVDWDRTITALEARVDRDGRGAPDQRVYQLHVQLGVAYRARGRIADALREFDAAVALQPSASDLQILRALTLERVGRSQEAGRAFRAAWTLDPHNPIKAYYVAQRPDTGSGAERERARAVLTDRYRRLGPDVARPAVPPFASLDGVPDNLSNTPVIADAATAEGFGLLAEGKYSEGVAALNRPGHGRDDKTDDSPLAHFLRGKQDEAGNQVAEARREYQAALAGTLVGRSVLAVAIARLAQVDGDLDAAVDAFTRAARLNPNDPNIHKEFAGAYTAQGRADDAFCELMAALLIDPRDAQAHAAIAQLYLDTGRDAEAVSAFTRVLQLTPDRYETRYALATALERLGRTEEAATQLDIFERVRREMLERRRRDIAREVEQEEAVGQGLPDQGGAR